MQVSPLLPSASTRQFPPFHLARLLKTVFKPQKNEKLCIFIDLDEPKDVINWAYLKKPGNPVQKKAYEIFYQQLRNGVMQELGLSAVDFFAYKKTGGSNLELPDTAISPEGKAINLSQQIYPKYDIILCLTDYSATAPLTASAKKYGFRGSTMHGLNDVILKSGLSVDYNEVSRETEKLRKGMTGADSVDIDFSFDHKDHHLHIDLGRQEAQKSHGICHEGKDIVNLPAGEVYFVPRDARGAFPIKFEDGTFGLMQVEKGRVVNVGFLKGNKETIKAIQAKFDSDPSASILGELGFGTQVLPYSSGDIQDEKIFGTFHLATGRNDHLNGSVTLDRFVNRKNATHDDILFSSTKTPEIQVKQVRMKKDGKTIILIENYEPCQYLLNLLQA